MPYSLFPMAGPGGCEDAWDGLVGAIAAPVTKAAKGEPELSPEARREAESAALEKYWETILAPLRVEIDPASVPDPPRLGADRRGWAYYASKNRGN